MTVINPRAPEPEESDRRFNVLAAIVAAVPLAMLIFWAILRWSLSG